MHFGENAFFFEGGAVWWTQVLVPLFSVNVIFLFAYFAEDKVTCLKLLTLFSRYNYYVTLCQVLDCSVEYFTKEA